MTPCGTKTPQQQRRIRTWTESGDNPRRCPLSCLIRHPERRKQSTCITSRKIICSTGRRRSRLTSWQWMRKGFGFTKNSATPSHGVTASRKWLSPDASGAWRTAKEFCTQPIEQARPMLSGTGSQGSVRKSVSTSHRHLRHLGKSIFIRKTALLNSAHGHPPPSRAGSGCFPAP